MQLGGGGWTLQNKPGIMLFYLHAKWHLTYMAIKPAQFNPHHSLASLGSGRQAGRHPLNCYVIDLIDFPKCQPPKPKGVSEGALKEIENHKLKQRTYTAEIRLQGIFVL